MKDTIVIQEHVKRFEDYLASKHPDIDTADVIECIESLSDLEYPTCLTCTAYPPGAFMACPNLMKLMTRFAEEVQEIGLDETISLFKIARDLADDLMPEGDSKNANFVIKFFEWYFALPE